MGADHKGPLAAFVVVAVVAAIVLVTSVRSQAVEMLTTVGHHLDRAVSSGVDVVERTVSTTLAPPRVTPSPHPAQHASRRLLPVRGGHAHPAHHAPVVTVGPTHGQTHGAHHGPVQLHSRGHHVGWRQGGPPGHAHRHSQTHGHGLAHGRPARG